MQRKRISLSDIRSIGERAESVLERIREVVLAPTAQKAAPTFTASQLQSILGIERGKFEYRLGRQDLPTGVLDKSNRRRFSLEEFQVWARAMRPAMMRPAGAEGVVISLANFKGGVAKTTMAVAIAQAFSLRGHKVLLVDLDAQASTTALVGVPQALVDYDSTINRLADGSVTDPSELIMDTYWPGMQVIPAGLTLYSAEFELPGRQQKSGPGFEFWHVLRDGLDLIRKDYDVIIIDTPPALGYLTINALLAADGLVIPLPPSTLDFMSSVQFFQLFIELATNLVEEQGQEKHYDFINILLSKVDANDSTSSIVRGWITAAYQDLVLPVEIPKTSLAGASSAMMGTVYDTQPGSVNQQTYRRAFDAFERVALLIEEQVVQTWADQSGGKK